MTRRLVAVAIALICVIAATPAFARHHKFSHRHHYRHHYTVNVNASDPRPRQWCAWWLRRYLHIPRSAFPRNQYNLARAFARIGSPAPHGCTGCIAVFSRGRGGHVGLVKSWDANGNPVILSGNFNGRVGIGAHPKRRLIALRWAG